VNGLVPAGLIPVGLVPAGVAPAGFRTQQQLPGLPALPVVGGLQDLPLAGPANVTQLNGLRHAAAEESTGAGNGALLIGALLAGAALLAGLGRRIRFNRR